MLKHGDRLVIGGNHYFKVINPYDELCSVKLSTQAIDFEFAYQEILRVQEERYILLVKIKARFFRYKILMKLKKLIRYKCISTQLRFDLNSSPVDKFYYDNYSFFYTVIFSFI